MRHAIALLAALPIGLAGCIDACPAGSARAADGLCTLDDEATEGEAGQVAPDGRPDGTDPVADADTADDQTDPPHDGLGFELGDPIVTVTRLAYEDKTEWMDAVMIDERYGLVVGRAGWEVVDLAAGVVVTRVEAEIGERVDTDGQTAVMSGAWGELLRLDVSDPTHPRPLASIFRPGDAAIEDVSIDGDLILAGWGADGARLYDAAGRALATLPATEALGVAVRDDRALVADQDTLTLYDLTDPRAPRALDAVGLQGFGVDIDFDGDRVVVAQGGAGVEVYTVTHDALVFDGFLDVPGTSAEVALDGDRVWVAAWDRIALAWIGPGGPVVLGHEPAQEAAFGVGAAGGQALVADWQGWMHMAAVDGVAGPELTLPEALWLHEPGAPVVLPVRNHGPYPLHLTLEAPSGVRLDPTELELAPGSRANVVVTPPAEIGRDLAITVRSNDADEPTATVLLRVPTADVSALHPPIELPAFTLPDRSLRTWSLDAHRGKVVLLAYWSLF